MKSSSQARVVLVTAPNRKTAKKIARAAIKDKLAACANIIPKVQSIYWWEEKVESSQELLIIFKTTANQLVKLEKSVVEHHPYDTPEFIVLPIQAGAEGYLDWISASVQPAKPAKKRR